MHSKGTAVDLFSGAGGASEGIEQAGFEVAAANEINAHAALTYKFNHPDTELIQKDVRKLTSKELLRTVNRIDLLFAGIPCQGFSNAGRKDTHDRRNYLFREVIRLAREIKPPFVLIENVAGLLAQRNRPFLGLIEAGMKRTGYTVSHRLFDTSEFGVPQRRRRILILASQDKDVTLESFSWKSPEVVSVMGAIGDLDFLDHGIAAEYLKLPRTLYQKKMRGSQKELWNHETARHSRKVARRFSILREGEVMRTALPRSRTRKIYTVKLQGGELSPTMTTMPDDYVHYALPRTLTVREMARLQSFRDSYLFLGPRTTGGTLRRMSVPQYTQVGNAVPPLFLKQICLLLAKTMS